MEDIRTSLSTGTYVKWEYQKENKVRKKAENFSKNLSWKLPKIIGKKKKPLIHTFKKSMNSKKDKYREIHKHIVKILKSKDIEKILTEAREKWLIIYKEVSIRLTLTSYYKQQRPESNGIGWGRKIPEKIQKYVDYTFKGK